MPCFYAYVAGPNSALRRRSEFGVWRGTAPVQIAVEGHCMKIKFALPTILTAILVVAQLFVFATPVPRAPRRIEVTAKRYEFNPSDITLKKDEPVVLVLRSLDVAHGIHFKELGLETKLSKGGTSELVFTPVNTGIFVGHCSVFCGSGHGQMTLTLHVVE